MVSANCASSNSAQSGDHGLQREEGPNFYLISPFKFDKESSHMSDSERSFTKECYYAMSVAK